MITEMCINYLLKKNLTNIAPHLTSNIQVFMNKDWVALFKRKFVYKNIFFYFKILVILKNWTICIKN